MIVSLLNSNLIKPFIKVTFIVKFKGTMIVEHFQMIFELVQSIIQRCLIVMISMLEISRNLLLLPYLITNSNTLDEATQRYIEIVNTDLRIIYNQE